LNKSNCINSDANDNYYF